MPTPSASAERRLRIMALHGGQQDADAFSRTVPNMMRTILSKTKLDVEFVFPNAPFPAVCPDFKRSEDGTAGAAQAADKTVNAPTTWPEAYRPFKFYEREANEKKRTWFGWNPFDPSDFRYGTHGYHTEGLVPQRLGHTLRYLEGIWAEAAAEGRPFDGVLGFSQAGAVASMFVHHVVRQNDPGRLPRPELLVVSAGWLSPVPLNYPAYWCRDPDMRARLEELFGVDGATGLPDDSVTVGERDLEPFLAALPLEDVEETVDGEEGVKVQRTRLPVKPVFDDQLTEIPSFHFCGRRDPYIIRPRNEFLAKRWGAKAVVRVHDSEKGHSMPYEAKDVAALVGFLCEQRRRILGTEASMASAPSSPPTNGPATTASTWSRLAGLDLAPEEVQYFQKHGVPERLASLVQQVAAVKPDDPYRFMSDSLAKHASAAAPGVTEATPVRDAAKGSGPAQPASPQPPPKAKPGSETRKAKNEAALAKPAKSEPAKGGGVGVRKSENVAEWYEQVNKKAEMIQNYPVKGCFTLRPWAYRIWELIQGWFDGEIKKLGVENCYFPMFIPKCYLHKEESHLNDFKAEVAWVTKFSDQDLEEPVAIRPTSETAMYDAYANWVQSHRDLPIKLNQWCSVVRWEVKQTTPFLRTREFLWQEGHTAHAGKADADREVLDILELYARVYEEHLAVPVVRGTKTRAETFPGADYTTTVEAFVPATGRAIQGATSHHLGQNFSKMFGISFQDPTDPSGKARQHAYQNSWGITQRTLGVMVMVHGDDKGLVLPPRVAGLQVVIVQVGLKVTTPEDQKQALGRKAAGYRAALEEAGVRVRLDDGEQTAGWKFNHWELKGVPVRLEIGPADVQGGTFVMALRNAGAGGRVTGRDASMVEEVKATLERVQREMYERALEERDRALVSVDEWGQFSPNLNEGKLLLVPFCGSAECEEAIKARSKEESRDEETVGGLKMGAKALCVPHEAKYSRDCPARCIFPDCACTTVQQRTLFGRSY